MERTLVLIKPDAVQRGLIGEVISRFERKGLKIVGMRMMALSEAVLREHYAHIADKPFFAGIERYMMSSPVIAVAVEGVDAVDTMRRVVGITKSREADPGTIRGDLAMSIACNIVHASDSVETAQEEIKRFFEYDDIHQYDRGEVHRVYAEDELDR